MSFYLYIISILDRKEKTLWMYSIYIYVHPVPLAGYTYISDNNIKTKITPIIVKQSKLELYRGTDSKILYGDSMLPPIF